MTSDTDEAEDASQAQTEEVEATYEFSAATVPGLSPSLTNDPSVAESEANCGGLFWWFPGVGDSCKSEPPPTPPCKEAAADAGVACQDVSYMITQSNRPPYLGTGKGKGTIKIYAPVGKTWLELPTLKQMQNYGDCYGPGEYYYPNCGYGKEWGPGGPYPGVESWFAPCSGDCSDQTGATYEGATCETVGTAEVCGATGESAPIYGLGGEGHYYEFCQQSTCPGGYQNGYEITSVGLPYWCACDPDGHTDAEPPWANGTGPLGGRDSNHCVGDPIDCGTGAWVEEAPGLVVPTAVFPLESSIHYRSDTWANGRALAPIGLGWSMSYGRTLTYRPPQPPSSCVSSGSSVTCLLDGKPARVELLTEQGQLYTYDMDATQSTTTRIVFTPHGGTVGAGGYVEVLQPAGTLTEITMKLHHSNGDVDQYLAPAGPSDGPTTEFSALGTSVGKLANVRTRAGNGLDFTYSTGTSDCAEGSCVQEILHEVAANARTGRRLTREYRFVPATGGSRLTADGLALRLVEMRDSSDGVSATNARTTELSYDADGRLVRVDDPEARPVHYAYDSTGRISKRCDAEQDPSSTTADCLETTYDGWRVSEQRQPGGTLVELEWNPWVSWDGYDLRVRYSHPDTTETSVQYFLHDSVRKWLVVRRFVPGSGSYTQYEYDPLYPWVTKETDPDGYVTSYQRDTAGNPTTITRECLTGATDCAPLSYAMTYNTYGQLRTIDYPDGTSEEYVYDAATGFLQELRRKPIATSALAAMVWTYERNTAGQLTAVRLPDGTVNTSAYETGRRFPTGQTFDATHTLRTRTTTPLALSTSTTFDERGFLETSTDIRGIQTTYTIDDVGQVLGKEGPLPDGSGTTRTEVEYDDVGNITTVTSDVGGALERSAELTWAPIGHDGGYRLTSTTDPLGFLVEYEHHPIFGEVSKVIEYLDEADQSQRVTELQYASAGWWPQSVTLRGNPDVTTDDRTVSTTSYYPSGRVYQSQDGRGALIRYAYDGLGRPKTTSLPAIAAVYETQYDAGGRVWKQLAPAGLTETIAYDDYGRAVTSTDANGNKVVIELDELGRTVETHQLAANSTVPLEVITVDYDAVGRSIRTEVDPGGLAEVTRFSYQQTGVTDRWTLKSVTDPRNNVTKYEYDRWGAIQKVTDADNGVVEVTPDRLGRPILIEDQLGVVTELVWNAGDQLESSTRGSGAAEPLVKSWTYRTDGSPETYTDPANRVTTYEYDGTGRLEEVRYPAGDEETVTAPDVSYTYEYNDLIKSATAGTLSVNYTWDAVNRFADRRGADSQHVRIGHRYDSSSRLEAILHGGSGTTGDLETKFTYSALVASGLPTTMTAFGDTGSVLTWGPTDLLASVSRPNGVLTASGFDAARRLTSVGHAVGTTTDILALAYGYDDAGNRNRIEENGRVTDLTYDALGRLWKEQLVGGNPRYHDYDAIGNLESRTDDLALDYDDSIHERIEGLEYDGNGNLTFDGKTTFVYDTANRLVRSVNEATGREVNYFYDPVGNLVRQTVEEGSTTVSDVEFVHDDSGMMSTVAEVRSASGRIDRYSWGVDGLHARRRSITGATTSELAYALTDALGSVRGWTDAAGAVIEERSFDVWGRLDKQAVPNSQSIHAEAEDFAASGDLVGSGTVVDWGFGISNVDDGDWIRFDNVNFEGGAVALRFSARIATPNAGNKIRVYIDGLAPQTAPFAEIVTRATTLDSDDFGTSEVQFATSTVCSSAVTAGPHTVFVYFDGSENAANRTNGWGIGIGNFDWFELRAEGSCTMPSDPKEGFFGYAGEWHNPDGSIFLRNRVYHAKLARFLQRDTYPGSIAAPMSLNAYSYVENNPATLVDPLGFAACRKRPKCGPLEQEVFVLPVSGPMTSRCESNAWGRMVSDNAPSVTRCGAADDPAGCVIATLPNLPSELGDPHVASKGGQVIGGRSRRKGGRHDVPRGAGGGDDGSPTRDPGRGGATQKREQNTCGYAQCANAIGKKQGRDAQSVMDELLDSDPPPQTGPEGEPWSGLSAEGMKNLLDKHGVPAESKYGDINDAKADAKTRGTIAIVPDPERPGHWIGVEGGERGEVTVLDSWPASSSPRTIPMSQFKAPDERGRTSQRKFPYVVPKN